MPQALIPESLYLALQERRGEMHQHGVPGWDYAGIANLAAVFVPVRPCPAAAVPFTALIIGQATHNYDPEEAALRGYERTTAHNVALAADYLAHPATPFWRWCRAVFVAAYHALGVPEPTEQQLLGSLGWSNLAKIGDTKKNPPPWTVMGQTELASQAILAEIQAMQPSIILVCVGRFGVGAGRAIFQRTFGAVSWDGRSITDGRLAGRPVVFMPHPFSLTARPLWAASVAAAARHIVLSIGQRPPPVAGTATGTEGPLP